MNKLLSVILTFIKKLFSTLSDKTKKLIPVAINVVEGIKTVLDGPLDDVVLSIIDVTIPAVPVEQVSLIKDKIQQSLPKILLELNLINNIANEVDINTQLQLILNQLKLSSDDIKAEKYHTIASKLLVILSDGKITWGESVMFTEWYYQTYMKK